MAAGFTPVPQIGGDATATLQAMIDALDDIGGGVLALGPYEYSITGLLLATDVTIQGMGMGVSGFRLAAGSNAHVLEGVDVSRVGLRDLYIDGNKANQSIGTGNNWRGIYFRKTDGGDYGDHRILDVEVRDTVDHGCMFSGTGERSKVIRCRAIDCGSAAHLAAGGAGGTGFGGWTDVTHAWCYASGCHLNGFKTDRGHLYHCVAEDCGGGFETGFNASAGTHCTYIDCWARRCGGGWRHQGEGDLIKIIGGGAEECDSSGITILGPVDRILISGVTLRNNGQDPDTYPRSSTTGLDGITILSNASDPTNIEIDGCTLLDDQGTATQQYGIYVGGTPSIVHIGQGNNASGNASGALYLAPGAANKVIRVQGFPGYAGEVHDTTPVTVTGTTETADLMSHPLPANSLHIGSRVKVAVAGYTRGTAGTKVIRIVWGASSQVISSQIAANQIDWAASAVFEVYPGVVPVGGGDASPRQLGSFVASENGGEEDHITKWFSNSLASAVDLKVTCTLGSASDSIVQTMMTVTTER